MTNKIEQFLDYINEIFGVYLDSVEGFNLFLTFIEKAQQSEQCIQLQAGLSIEELNRLDFIRGNGDPSSCIEMHRMTLGEFKRNNARGGLNHRKALEYCLCDLFNRWNEFKKDVLKKSGAADKDIMPVMCYLKQVRDRLTHNRDDLKNGKKIFEHPLKHLPYTLPAFDVKQFIELSVDDLDAIIVELRRSLQANSYVSF